VHFPFIIFIQQEHKKDWNFHSSLLETVVNFDTKPVPMQPLYLLVAL